MSPSITITTVVQDVIDRGVGAGETTCFECEGTGDWTPFHPEPKGFIQCTDCKGTGRVFVSV